MGTAPSAVSFQVTTPSKEYALRIERVLRYIGEHTEEDLTLETLSRLAGFSPFHFHRQFREFTGISLGKFVSLVRLRKASLELAFSPAHRILDVALEAGFESPESFARAFRKALGQSPSGFRKTPQWQQWFNFFHNTVNTRSEPMKVQISKHEEFSVAVLEHRGPAENLMASVEKFIEWRKATDLSPVTTSKTLGIPYSDPETTVPEDFHFDICGSVKGDVPENEFGVIKKRIPGGRFAVARHLGSTDAIGKTVHALYGEWLPKSGEELKDFPCFFHYIARMPTVSEHEQITDVYLPLK